MSDTGLKPRARVDGRHELVERLDDRGAGEAWKARDPDFKTRLALLKVLGPLPAGTNSAPAPLVDLARRLRAVRHPTLLPMTGVGTHEGRAWVALAWFDGGSLAGALRDGDAPTLEALAKVFDTLCDAVAACHAAGVVHGGVTPGCVFALRGAGDDFDVRLADVGLAPFADQGTAFLYEDCAAPEVRNGKAPTPAVDVFGLGATLRRALAVSADAATWVEPTTGFRGRDDVPKAVWEAVAQATSVDPAARYESAASLRAALTEAWGDDARLPVRRAREPVVEAPREAPAEAAAPPPVLWDQAPAPAPAREPAFDEQKTTYKLPSLPGARASAPTGALSLDALLGDQASAPGAAAAPPVTATPSVPTGAQNPWSTDLLRREVHAGAQNPWSTDVLRREVPVAPATDDAATHVEVRREGATQASAPVRVGASTEAATPEQLRAAQEMAARAMDTAPRRSRTGVVVAVVVVVLAVLVALALALR